ncbi:MAG: hypothetical protein IRY97_00595 [Thermomicrobiaceae bacterium]|nr:hypothetical protein [Thermomicrobiaceae bacterium]
MTSLESIERIRERWLAFAREQDPACVGLSRLAFAALRRGQPLALAEARAALGLDEGSFAALVQRMVGRGLLTVDERGAAITGAAGLSVAPSRHRLLLEGRPLYAWCAFDAVGIPAALAADARVESRCAESGEPVWVDIVRGEPRAMSHPGLRVVLRAPDPARSICGATCPAITFGCSATSEPGDGAVLVPVAEAMRLGRECWAEMVR